MMGRRSQLLLAIVLLVVWILSGPVAFSFCHCAGMGVMCERACAPLCMPVCAPVDAPTSVAGPQITVALSIESPAYVPTPVIKMPKPPPRALRSSALVFVTLSSFSS
jgi:hypothetical protein